jgi:hypothetical protein
MGTPNKDELEDDDDDEAVRRERDSELVPPSTSFCTRTYRRSPFRQVKVTLESPGLGW